MPFMPDPLHPAVVHFPIVLILLGAVAAIVAAFWRGGHVPTFAAILLALGALGAWVAVESGEDSGGLLESGSPEMEAVLDAHQTWAKRTLAVTLVAAVVAIGSAFAGRRPRLARAVAVVAAIASSAAGWAVYETGHRGGALVYRHAAGVAMAVSTSASASDTPAAPEEARDAAREPAGRDAD